MNIKSTLALAFLVTASGSAIAGDVYGGFGFPGLVLGYSAPLGGTQTVSLRGEYAGGVTLKHSGQKDGTEYSGSFRSNRVGGFIDWFPLDNGFRFTGGLTVNDTSASLTGKGGPNSTINGKPVDLTGETYTVNMKYPTTTPFLGIGWGHQRRAQTGIGFFADVGVQFGRFKTDVQTSVVGKFGITQADVDAEASSVRDAASRYSILPSVTMGATYKF